MTSVHVFIYLLSYLDFGNSNGREVLSTTPTARPKDSASAKKAIQKTNLLLLRLRGRPNWRTVACGMYLAEEDRAIRVKRLCPQATEWRLKQLLSKPIEVYSAFASLMNVYELYVWVGTYF